MADSLEAGPRFTGRLMSPEEAAEFWRQSDRAQLIYWLTIGLWVAAIALRLFQLGAAQYWYDEAGTVLMARLPLLQVVRATATDTHPPLYFLIVWLMIRIGGQAEWWLRLPSVAASLASIALSVQLARRLGLNARACLITFALMVFSSFQVHYAQEARMYALLEVEVLALLIVAIDRRWLWYFIIASFMLYTHNYGLFYLPIVALFALGREVMRPTIWTMDPAKPILARWASVIDRGQVVKLVAVNALALLAWSPWTVALVQQMHTVAGGYWIAPITPGALLDALWGILWSFNMPAPTIALTVMATCGVLTFALWRAVQSREPVALRLVYLALAPFVVTVAVSLLWKPVLLFRGLIGAAPLLLMLAAWSIERLPRVKQLYAAVLIVPLLAAGLVGEYLYGPEQKGTLRAEIDLVRAQFQPGDIIVHAQDGSPVGWGTYAPDLPQIMVPRCKGSLGSYAQSTFDAVGVRTIDLAAVPHTRAWILYTEHPTQYQCQKDAEQALLASTGAVLWKDLGENEYVSEQIWLAGPARQVGQP